VPETTYLGLFVSPIARPTVRPGRNAAAEADVCFGGFSPAEHVAQADVIVAAKLVKVTEQEQPPQSGRVYRTYQFLVEKVYKGPIRPGESVQDAMPTI
jgi:hypothetical protein